MRTMTILIERDEATARNRFRGGFLRATRGRRYQGEIRSFESPAALFRVFTPARWSLIERLQNLGPVSLRALARALERDVKSVHRDVKVLTEEELVDRDAAGRVYVPSIEFTRNSRWPAPRLEPAGQRVRTQAIGSDQPNLLISRDMSLGTRSHNALAVLFCRRNNSCNKLFFETPADRRGS